MQIGEREQVEKYFVRCNMKDFGKDVSVFTSHASMLYIVLAFHQPVITGLIQVCKAS